MKRIATTILGSIICLCLSIPSAFATPGMKDEVTVGIPAGVLAQFINDVLPLEIRKNEKLSGSIWVQSIDDLKLGKDTVSFSVDIRGEDVRYRGKIGNLATTVEFGSIDASFKCEASIRYDREKHILYVKPITMEQRNKEEAPWSLLAALVAAREYPIEIKQLKPIIAKFSNRSATITLDISDIYTADNRLFVGIRPSVKERND